MDPLLEQNREWKNALQKQIIEISGCYIKNLELLVTRLVDQGVFSLADKLSIEDADWNYEKVDLVMILSQKDFSLVDRILHASRPEPQQNQDFYHYLKVIKNYIADEYRFDSGLLKPPVSIENLQGRISNLENGGVTESVLTHEMISKLDFDILKVRIDSLTSLDELVAMDPSSGETSLHACLNRKTKRIECFDVLICTFERLQNQGTGTWTLRKYVNKPSDELHKTVAHVAAENGMDEILQKLQTQRCEFLLKDKNGESAISKMWRFTPKAVNSILDKALTYNPDTRKFKVDFSLIIGNFPVIEPNGHHTSELRPMAQPSAGANSDLSRGTFGTSDQAQTATFDISYSEMALLAKNMDENPRGFNSVISHVVVKLFLELKWLNSWKLFLCLFFVRAAFTICYLWFVVEVYVVSAPLETFLQNTSQIISCTRANDNSFNATLMQQEKTIGMVNYSVTNPSQPSCIDHPGILLWAILLFLFFGLFLLIMEILELCLRCRQRQSFCRGTRSYFSCKNVIDLINTIVVMYTTSLPFKLELINEWHYAAAVVSSMISVVLLYMTFGYFHVGRGVQIFGILFKVAWDVIVSGPAAFIFAYAIIFSILFGKDPAFESLPLAVYRSYTMMMGDNAYKEMFDVDQSLGWLISLTRHFADGVLRIFGFLILSGVVALSISDFQALQNESEIIQLVKQADQLSNLEVCVASTRSLLRLRPPSRFLVAATNVLNSLDTFVIPPDNSLEQKGSNRLTIEIKASQISESLAKGLINLVAEKKQYK